jgi:hypothetical protein
MSYEVATEMVRQAFVEKYGYPPELFDNWLARVIEEGNLVVSDMVPNRGVWANESDEFKRGLKAKGDMWQESLKEGTVYHTPDDKWYKLIDVTEQAKAQRARGLEENK